jgi:sarcosine oxidase
MTGGLYTGTWAEDCAAGLTECGIAHDWLSASDASERFPAIQFEAGERVLYQAEGGVCLASKAIAAQVRLARARGVDLRVSEPVVRLTHDEDGVRVETAAGEIRAGVVVIAAGAWAPRLLDDVGIPLALGACVAQVSYFPRLDAGPPLPPLIEAGSGVGLLGAGGYWVPPAGEQTELKVSLGAPGPAVDPRAGPFAVDRELRDRDAAFAARRLRGFAREPSRSETCLYTMTPDEDFVLDRVGRVVIASCCSGHGFKFVPALGEIAADLALGTDPGFPLSRFSASRGAVSG